MSSQGEPYALNDVDGLLGNWFVEHSSADTQGPLLSFVANLCKHPPDDDEGSDAVWVPTPSGFQQVGLSWIIDHARRVVNLLDVRDIT